MKCSGSMLGRRSTAARCSHAHPLMCSTRHRQRNVMKCLAVERPSSLTSSVKNAVLSIGTAAIVFNPLNNAWADMVQTVPASQATQMARALPQQKVDKGKVWSVIVGGAVLLFVGTVAAENNSSLFPAISRANKAAADAKKFAEEAEKRAKLEETTASEVKRQTAIVEQGLAEARARVLSSPAAAAPAAPAAAAAASETGSSQPSMEQQQEHKQSTSSEATAAHAAAAPHAQANPDPDDAEAFARLASFASGMSSEGRQALRAAKAQQQGSDSSSS